MDLVQVDVVGAQTRQAGVHLGQDRLPGEARAVRARRASDRGPWSRSPARRGRPNSLSARPTISSLLPAEYTFAVSKKLIPASTACRISGRLASSSSVHGWPAAVRVAEAHAAQDDAGHLESGVAQPRVIHLLLIPAHRLARFGIPIDATNADVPVSRPQRTIAGGSSMMTDWAITELQSVAVLLGESLQADRLGGTSRSWEPADVDPSMRTMDQRSAGARVSFRCWSVRGDGCFGARSVCREGSRSWPVIIVTRPSSKATTTTALSTVRFSPRNPISGGPARKAQYPMDAINTYPRRRCGGLVRTGAHADRKSKRQRRLPTGSPRRRQATRSRAEDEQQHAARWRSRPGATT